MLHRHLWIRWRGGNIGKVRHKRISDEKLDVELENESGVLPKFHIGVFKELWAADASVREAAAKVLVEELREVQNAYDPLGG